MTKRGKYFLAPLFLAVLFFVLWVIKNVSKETLDFPIGRTIIPMSKIPQDVFKTYPAFFVLNRSVLDFAENKKPLVWAMDENISGNLEFEWIVFQSVKGEKTPLPQSCRLELLLKNEHNEKTLLQQSYTKNQFSKNKKAFFLNKSFVVPVETAAGNCLIFKMGFPDGFVDEDIMYGITVPKIKKTSQMSRSEMNAPNLLILSIDTLRPDYLGVYKKLREESFEFSYSPHLDEFAETAVVFKNAYTPLSATWPALASLLTSLYPCEHGILNNGENFQLSYDTMATYMLGLGYATLSLHGNAYGLSIPGIEKKYLFFNDDMALVKRALRNLQSDCDSPFFHWYHFVGVHAAYTPPQWAMTILAKEEPYRFYNLNEIMSGNLDVTEKEIGYIRKLYAGELYNLDFELEKIFAFLKINNLWENTMVIVTADHGEDLYEHNQYFYHYPSLYNSSLKIPLMIKFPYQKKRLVVEEPVSLLDIFPTVVDYFKKDGPSESRMQALSGSSLLPLIKGRKKAFRERTLFAGIEKFEVIAAIDKGRKIIYNPKKIIPVTQAKQPYPYDEIELYLVNKDRLEKNNVSKENGKLVRELIKKIEQFEKNHKKIVSLDSTGRTKVTKEDSQETLDHLRTLGYID